MDADLVRYHLSTLALDPPARSPEEWYVSASPSGPVVAHWAERLGQQPDWNALAASPEYLEWHRTHGGDPVATEARLVAERIQNPETVSEKATRAVIAMMYEYGLRELRAAVNEINSLGPDSTRPPLDAEMSLDDAMRWVLERMGGGSDGNQ
jgi:hypothetical protein